MKWKIRVFATLIISPSIAVTVFRRELILCHTVRRPEELRSESRLEHMITDSVRVLGSPIEKQYVIKLEERMVWDWTGLSGVIITPDLVLHGVIATSCDPEHVEILNAPWSIVSCTKAPWMDWTLCCRVVMTIMVFLIDFSVWLGFTVRACYIVLVTATVRDVNSFTLSVSISFLFFFSFFLFFFFSFFLFFFFSFFLFLIICLLFQQYKK